MKSKVILTVFVTAAAVPLAVYAHQALQPIPFVGLCPKTPIWSKVPGVENVFGIPKYATKEGEARAAAYRFQNYKPPTDDRVYTRCYYERGPD
jgi:hypothetical protein